MSDTPQPSFTLEAVRTNSFVERTSDISEDPGANIAVGYSPGFGFGFDKETGLLDVLIELVAVEADDEPEESNVEQVPIAEIQTVCQWKIHNLDDMKDDTGEVRIPRVMLAHLVGISISTTRGTLIGRARHGIFSRAPMPIGSPVFFIDQLIDQQSIDWVEEKRVFPVEKGVDGNE